jgi:hypothetical protein
MPDTLPLPILLFQVALFSCPIAWTYQLERQQCACSANWKRSVIRYGFAVAIALTVMRMFVTLPDQRLWFVRGLLTFALYVLTITYIGDLRAAKCKCAEGRTPIIMFWWIAVSIVVFILGRVALIMQHPQPSTAALAKDASGLIKAGKRKSRRRNVKTRR